MMVAAIEWGAVILLAVLLHFMLGLWIVQETAFFPQDSNLDDRSSAADHRRGAVLVRVGREGDQDPFRKLTRSNNYRWK
jgi:hypothetical protein